MRISKNLIVKPIALPLAFLMVSTFPLIFVSFILKDTVFFTHLVANLLLVAVAFIFSFLIPYSLNPFIILLRFLLRIRVRFSDPFQVTFLLITVFIIFEVIAIVFFGKPDIFSAMIFGDGMDRRIYKTEIPLYIGLLVNNSSALCLLLIGVILKGLVIGDVRKRLFLSFSGFFLIAFYVGSLKKSSFLILIYFILLVNGRLRGGLFKSSNIIWLVAIAPASYLVLLSYYPDGNILGSLLSRVFLESVGTSSTFVELYQRTEPLGWDFIPSEGARLFGFSGRNLENQLFKDLFPERGERYGNFSTLSYTYASVVFGDLGGWIFLITVFGINIQILRFLYKRYKTSDDYYDFLNFHLFSIMLFTCFVTGAFKTVTIFLLFPVSTYIYLAGFILVREFDVHKARS